MTMSLARIGFDIETIETCGVLAIAGLREHFQQNLARWPFVAI